MKKFVQNREFQLDEILFESKNKQYGAYVLRNEAGKTLMKSLFVGIGIFVVVSIVPFVLNSFKTKEVVEIPTNHGSIILQHVDTPEENKQAQAPLHQQQIRQVNTIVPTPSANPIDEVPPAKVGDYDHAVAGTQNIAGSVPVSPYTPPVVAPVAPTVQPEIQPVDNNRIVDKVDVNADFKGGIDTFRSKVQNNFDVSDFEGMGETMSTSITFVVEKDGTISSIKAAGTNAKFNHEAERTIHSVKGIWIPAKVKGEAVRSYFRFPISMKFE